ncbi:glycoside hydrolase family 3 protein [Vibrio astriarenae]|uniref:glycoside hydrolase family 3 protein n=1 Tax=Vibrio astriarenae TaxID=1481923 RepID=UPI003735D2FF
MNKNTSNSNQALAKVSRQMAAEGIVLLKNEQQTLPLKKSDVVSVFGRCQIDTYRSGTGSGGAVNVPYAVNIIDGLKANALITLNEELAECYSAWVKDNPFDNGGGGWAAEPWYQAEMPLEKDLVKKASKCSNKAIVIVGRTAGEEQDNAQLEGSYYLTPAELNMLECTCREFKQVIVVLNVTNIIDMSWVDSLAGKSSIKAIVYSWAAGMEGGHALADVLSGIVSPSGRLTDSIAHDIADYPSHINFGGTQKNLYQEDIYVGYRYFETFKPEAVKYEFGFGMSYSRFERNLINYQIEGEGEYTKLTFTVLVSNTGEYTSKDVVQLYVEAPQGSLGKSSRQLVAFDKTHELEPGESTEIILEVPVSRFSAYDENGVSGFASCYILESGNYRFYLGESVKKAKIVDAIFSVKSNLCVETLREAMAPTVSFSRMKPGVRSSQGTYSLLFEAAPTRKSSISQRIKNNLPSEITQTGNQGIKLIDVKNGKATLDDFIAQLTIDDLAAISRGEGMCSPKVTPGTAGAFGGVTEHLIELGLPVAAAADGPSGIRMDSGHLATQVPIGTLMGCSWNSDLNEELYYLVGLELRLHKIDTLLGPGINLHRHPLNGRNFEYFSEDALLTGFMAAAQTRGLARAGVTGTIKHFVANDQETSRKDVDSVVSERALRELHLKPFEIAVKEGGASTIMTAYNPVNGYWTASNYDLTTTILREEWGYTGIVMSDWWAKMNHPIEGGEATLNRTSAMIRAQNDLYMVVDNNGATSNAGQDDTIQAFNTGELTLGELQRTARNICRFLLKTPAMDRPIESFSKVKSFQPDTTSAFDRCIASIEHIQFDDDNRAFINVEESGIYNCIAHIKYERDGTAQSSCNLSINDQFAMTLPIHGTNGKSVKVEGQNVSLKIGRYRLNIESVRPGLELEHLSLTKQP